MEDNKDDGTEDDDTAEDEVEEGRLLLPLPALAAVACTGELPAHDEDEEDEAAEE